MQNSRNRRGCTICEPARHARHARYARQTCEADVRGTQVSLKNTSVSLKSTQASLNSSPVNLTVSIYVGGCSCLACFVHASHVSLACLAGSHILETGVHVLNSDCRSFGAALLVFYFTRFQRIRYNLNWSKILFREKPT